MNNIERINFAGLSELIATCVRGTATFDLPADIQPAPFYPAKPGLDLVGRYADAIKRGESLIRRNKVAPFTIAVGQGTRLAFDGPKGAFPISPVKNESLFRLFAEFSPVKNARGIDSEVSARRDMNRRAAAWLDAAGFDVPYHSDGEPDGLFEIRPLMALDADQLHGAMAVPPTITPGQPHYWE